MIKNKKILHNFKNIKGRKISLFSLLFVFIFAIIFINNKQVKISSERDNLYLKKLSISSGKFNEKFERERLEYTSTVSSSVENIIIDAEAEDKNIDIIGIGKKDLKVGSNEFEILSLSENGNIREYKIIVTREKILNLTVAKSKEESDIIDLSQSKDASKYEPLKMNVINSSNEINKNLPLVSELLLNNNKIQIVVGEEYQIEATAFPDETLELEYIYLIEDEEIISIDNKGIVTGQKQGSTKAEIKVKGNETIKTEIEIEVVNDKITSSIYDVFDKDEGRIIIGADEGEKIKEFLDKIDNIESMLKVYDKEDNLVTDYEDIIKTGMRIKLEINEKEYDEVIIIVRGDSNCDGYIDVADRVELQNHILSRNEITGYRIYALDLDEDGILDVSDKKILTDYIFGDISSLN